MKKDKPRVGNKADLRRRAEERLEERRRRGVKGAAPSEADARRLIQELEVHQIELEIQNEELLAARQETQAALERYTEIYDFAPLGYAVLAEDGSIRELNLKGAQRLGLERAKLVGRGFEAFVSERDRPAFGRFFVHVLERAHTDNAQETAELSLIATGGEEFAAVLTAALVERTTRSVLLAIEDITQRKRAEATVREAAMRKDEFIAILSHELRNPLAPIRNSLYILEHATPGGEQARRSQSVIARQVAHLTHLVDDLLDVSRITRGKVVLQRERVELGDLVRRTMDDHRDTFNALGLRLEGRFGSELIWVEADPTRLVQVLGNLLTNAAKFTPRGGLVEVVLRREGNSAILRVRDTGVGIAPEDRPRLFEPFAQASQNLDRTHGGLGLGLAMVKGLVELHGGSVGIASGGSGQGTEVGVQLPLADDLPRTGHEAHARPATRRRVLVIEDNQDAADSLAEALALDGHDIQVAYDGPTGIALARDFRPEAVLCDIGLPGMDGYAVARCFRSDPLLKATYLVALTGYAQPEDQERATLAGFDWHIAKPPSLVTLERTLAQAPETPVRDQSSRPVPSSQ
jgi:PAS domain S-box-containing protein